MENPFLIISHYNVIFFICLFGFFHFFETGSHYPLQVSLENNDPPASASGIIVFGSQVIAIHFLFWQSLPLLI